MSVQLPVWANTLGCTKRAPQKLQDQIWSALLAWKPSDHIAILDRCTQGILDEAELEDSTNLVRSTNVQEAHLLLATVAFNLLKLASREKLAEDISSTASALHAQRRSQGKPDETEVTTATSSPPPVRPVGLTASAITAAAATTTQQQVGRSTRTRCPKCRHTVDSCTCAVVQQPSLPPRRKVKPDASDDDDVIASSSSASTSVEDDDDDDDDFERLSESVHATTLKDRVSLEDPADIAEPSRWPAAVAEHGNLEVLRGVKYFYRDVITYKPRESEFILDMVSIILKTMEATTKNTAAAKTLVLGGERLRARFEFYLSEARHGAKAASVSEAELLNRRLPKALRDARRLAEKRAAEESRLSKSIANYSNNNNNNKSHKAVAPAKKPQGKGKREAPPTPG